MKNTSKYRDGLEKQFHYEKYTHAKDICNVHPYFKLMAFKLLDILYQWSRYVVHVYDYL